MWMERFTLRRIVFHCTDFRKSAIGPVPNSFFAHSVVSKISTGLSEQQSLDFRPVTNATEERARTLRVTVSAYARFWQRRTKY
jgi:hypothetical protein